MGQNRLCLIALAKKPAAMLLAIAALAIQVFVVSPHVDGLSLQLETARNAAVAASVQSADKSAPATCLICEEAAVARTALLASPPVVALVAHTLFLSTPLPALAILETRPRRPWQSRAPPSHA